MPGKPLGAVPHNRGVAKVPKAKTTARGYPVSLDQRTVTHRMTRYAKRETVGKQLEEGLEPRPFNEVCWEVTCACTRVFRGHTELEASGSYLNHLPKPKKQR